MGKSRFYPFFKTVHNIDFLTCSQKHEGNIAVLEHVKNFVKQNLLRLLDIKINVFEYKENTNILFLLKVLLHMFNHFNGVLSVG